MDELEAGLTPLERAALEMVLMSPTIRGSLIMGLAGLVVRSKLRRLGEGAPCTDRDPRSERDHDP